MRRRLEVLPQALAVLEDALAVDAVPVVLAAVQIEGRGGPADLAAFETGRVCVSVVLYEIFGSYTDLVDRGTRGCFSIWLPGCKIVQGCSPGPAHT